MLGALAILLVAAASVEARTGPVELGAAANNHGVLADPDARYRETLSLYDAMTPESAMKIVELQPERDRFEFGAADGIVQFARERGKKVHGHTLTWCFDRALPAWLRDGTWTRAELLGILEKHITTVMTRYRGRVTSWDVVNEALNDEGGMRDCLWLRVIGPDWVEQAFRFARRADPDARLFYNEIRGELPYPKFNGLIALAEDFRRRGVPLDGVGIQLHLVPPPAPLQADLEETMRRLGELGLDVHISELDVPVWYLGRGIETKFARQADVYRTVASACQAQPACFRLTTWGFTDRYTWRQPSTSSMPLPFDSEYRPKPAWAALQEVLRPPPAPEPPPPPPAPEPAPPVPEATAAQEAAAQATAATAKPPPTLSAKVRRKRRRTWLRRRQLPILVRLASADAARIEVVAKLRGRTIARSDLDLPGQTATTVDLPLSAFARRLLRRADRSRLVVDVVASDAAGQHSRARVRSRLR
jgi:endo-1,4-beta-xylanase